LGAADPTAEAEQIPISGLTKGYVWRILD
jgi:hypothetical protein